MKFNRYDQNYHTYTRWQNLCGAKNSFRIKESKVFSGLLPESFLGKSNYVVLMEKDISGSSVFVANFNRIDPNSSGSFIDLHPYIVAFDHSGSICKGGFLEHGNWDGRTTEYFDAELWAIVSGSGVLNYLPIAQLPETTSGSITELGISSQNEAFLASLREIVKQ